MPKIGTCLVAGLTFAGLLLLLGNGGTVWWFPPVVVFSLVGISLFAALVFPFVWHYKENHLELNSEKIYGVLYTLIRYSIAFSLASFGWKKILGLQFVVPVEIASKPMNQQTGEWLTWYYFGYSHTFGLIIAGVQIISSFLLLFRRTMLLAEVILFSFMLNLTLINTFYGMNAGALLQSVVLTTGILFLLLSEFNRLAAFFLKTTSQIPSLKLGKPSIKGIIRVSVIVLSLLFTIYLKFN
ncbi:MAG TPA: hypothetical protein VGB63_10890 [Pedobacter sp.]|jgi:hypothetical protein